MLDLPMTRSPFNALVLIIFILIFSPSLSHAQSSAAFMLGDSLYDVGTNTYVLRAIAKATYPHYGVDFFNKTPNGRFSNGLNMADFSAKIAFGESYTSPPPFQSLFGAGINFHDRLMEAIDFDPMRPWEGPVKSFNFGQKGGKEKPCRGINFASSGCGILDESSKIDQAVAITQQLAELMYVHGNLTARIGAEETRMLFLKATYFLCIGNNDVNFYALFRYKFNTYDYMEKLIRSYNSTLRTLYNLGARKFAIFGIPYVGCSPLIRVTIPGGNCSKTANDLAQHFNDRLEEILKKMVVESEGFAYSFGDSYNVLHEFYEYPERFAFKETNKACCGIGRFNAMSNCHPAASLCKEREKYLFFDVSHPSERAARILMEKFATSGKQHVRPITWAKLASL